MDSGIDSSTMEGLLGRDSLLCNPETDGLLGIEALLDIESLLN